MSDTELVDCPRCGLPAELDLRMDDSLIHSVCPRGHDHALSPSVLEHLRSVDDGWPGIDRCGQLDPERLDP